MNLAKAYLNANHFEESFALANNLLRKKDISTQYKLAMRFVSICSLVFQRKHLDAANQLKDFIKYYQYSAEEYTRDRTWSYSTMKEFITTNNKLTQEQIKLLLQLVDLLESPKKQGDKKLKELEIAVQDVFK